MNKCLYFHEPKAVKVQTTSEITPYFTMQSVINCFITSLHAQLNAIRTLLRVAVHRK